MKADIFNWFDNWIAPPAPGIPFDREHVVGEVFTEGAFFRILRFRLRVSGETVMQICSLKATQMLRTRLTTIVCA